MHHNQQFNPATDSSESRADALDPTTVSSAGAPGGAPVSILEQIRLPQNYQQTLCVEPIVLMMPLRKPSRHEFIRVHPDADRQVVVAALKLKIERDETYVLAPAIAEAFPGEATPMQLRQAITRDGVSFLWPLRLPGEDGRLDAWSESALRAAKAAEHQWVSVRSNQYARHYDAVGAKADLGEPQWPARTFEELLKLALKDLLIETTDHPVLRKIRGER